MHWNRERPPSGSLDRLRKPLCYWTCSELVPLACGAAKLIEKADELDKMINADLWDTKQVLGAWLRARKLWCEVTGEPLL